MNTATKDGLKQSEIGLIPEDWEVTRLDSVCKYINRGISPKYSGKGFHVLNQKCVRDGRISLIDIKCHDNDFNFPQQKIIKENDILINSTGVGTLGRSANVIDKLGERYVADSHLTIVRIDSEKSYPLFVSYYLLSIQHVLENLGEGTSG